MSLNTTILAASALIASFSVPVALYFAVKKAISDLKTDLDIEAISQKGLEYVRHYLEDWLNSEKGQKAMYGVGQYIGAGAKSTLMGGKSGGKYGWLETGLGVLRDVVGKKAENTAETAITDGFRP